MGDGSGANSETATSQVAVAGCCTSASSWTSIPARSPLARDRPSGWGRGGGLAGFAQRRQAGAGCAGRVLLALRRQCRGLACTQSEDSVGRGVPLENGRRPHTCLRLQSAPWPCTGRGSAQRRRKPSIGCGHPRSVSLTWCGCGQVPGGAGDMQGPGGVQIMAEAWKAGKACGPAVNCAWHTGDAAGRLAGKPKS
jgi:hypothetical protein